MQGWWRRIPVRAADWIQAVKKLASILVSLLVLALLYSFLDVEQIWRVIGSANPIYLLCSMILLLILVGLSGLRLLLLCRATGMDISLNTALEATFVASALNLFLPGKAGDIFKAASMAGKDGSKLPQAIAIGVWEKLSELGLLLLIGALAFAVMAGDALTLAGACAVGVLIFGLLLYWPPPRQTGGRFGPAVLLWASTLARLRAEWPRTSALLAMSMLIWIGHVLQICMMAAALGVTGDASIWLAIAARIPLVVIAGLVPLTFMGIGTRDGAMIVLFQPFMSTETAAALGVLFWLRYLVPGLIALPLLPRFFRLSGEHVEHMKRPSGTAD
jgi:uncharacterized membrane protein YbhN (UPF0104 family)